MLFKRDISVSSSSFPKTKHFSEYSLKSCFAVDLIPEGDASFSDLTLFFCFYIPRTVVIFLMYMEDMCQCMNKCLKLSV